MTEGEKPQESLNNEHNIAALKFSKCRNNKSFRVVYSERYTARMQQIQQLREDKLKAANKDLTGSRAVNTGFVFPSTRYMDLARGESRGFNGFKIEDKKLPPNCIMHRGRSVRVSPENNGFSHAPQNTRSPVCAPSPPTYSKVYAPMDTNPVKRMLYPPSPPSTSQVSTCLDAADIIRNSSHAAAFHLILQVHVAEVTGSMKVYKEKFGLLAITTNTNKIEMSLALRDQLSLHEKCFLITIKNAPKTNKKTISFQAQYSSVDPRDVMELSDFLCESSIIHIRSIKTNMDRNRPDSTHRRNRNDIDFDHDVTLANEYNYKDDGACDESIITESIHSEY